MKCEWKFWFSLLGLGDGVFCITSPGILYISTSLHLLHVVGSLEFQGDG